MSLRPHSLHPSRSATNLPSLHASREVVVRLLRRIAGQPDPWLLIQDEASALLIPVSAGGVALFHASRVQAFGLTPAPSALRALVSKLELLPPSPSLVQTLDLSPADPGGTLVGNAPTVSLLAARLGSEPDAPWLAFFRDADSPRSPSDRTPGPWSDLDGDFIRQLALLLHNGLLLHERREADARWQQTEQRRAAVLAAMPDLFFVLDPEGVYLDAHIPADTPALRPREQLIGLTVHEVLPPVLAQEVAAALERIFNRGSAREVLKYSVDVPGHGLRHYESRYVPAGPGQVLCLARDISQRKAALNALVEERTLLKTVFEDSLAGFWDARFDTRQAYYSDAYLKMLGRTREECPADLQAWQKFAFPEDVAATRAAFRKHVESRGETPYRSHIRFRHRDGSTLHIICSGRVISWGPHGEPLRAVGCHIDFTSLYEAQESVSQLALVARYAASAVIFTDTERRITWVNEAFTRMTGYSALEALARSPAFLQGPDTNPATILAIRQALADKQPFRGEILNYTKTGHPYWLDLQIIPYLDSLGRFAGFIGVQMDITERKETELALRARDERFAAISRHLPGAIYQYRLSLTGVGRFLFATEGAERIWGLPPSEFVGRDDALAERVYPDDLPTLRESMRRSAETLVPAETTIRYHHPTLGLRHLRSTDTPTREADGSTVWYGYAFDVTDLVHAEQALRNNQASLNTLVQAIPSSVWLKDAEGRYVLVNEHALRALGILDLDWRGRTDLELAALRPALLPVARNCTESDEAAWLAGTRLIFEESVPDAERPDALFEVVKVPLLHGDGSRRGLVVVATDITERKRHADQLDRERRLFAVGPIAALVWRASPGWPVSYVSANIQAILGYPASEFTRPGFSYLDLIHPEDREKLVADNHARFAKNAPYFESSYRLRHVSGDYRWFYDFTQPEYDRDETLVSIRSFLFDQTKLKQAQDALLQREKQIAAISAHVPGMLYEFQRSPDGRASMPYVSEGIRELLALTPDQVRHDASAFFERVHPDDLAAFICSIETAYSARVDWSADFRIRHPERGLRWLHGSSSPRRVESGDYVWDGYCFDITDRKKAEEELLREGKREAIERLAGGVAHDFNNYLCSLALAGDLLINEPGLTARARQIAGSICSEVAAAAAVARQLLAFTKDQPIHLEPILLEPFLRNCADFALRGSATRAVVDVCDHKLQTVSDPDLLRQALFNLVLNARQALSDKGAKGEIRLSATASAEGVILQVADSGPGIPESQRPKIFEPYFTTKAAGSGLGLFVVRSILRRLGGDIVLDPSATHGACFVIQLPQRSLPETKTLSSPPFALPTFPSSVFPQAATGVGGSSSPRVLLLEDDPKQTQLLASFFDALQVPCQVFDSGEALLAAAPAHAVAGPSTICMLDITIRGGLGGLEIAPALRGLLPQARLFLVSGYSSDWPEKEQSLAGLGIVFIAKPYRLKDLRSRLFAA